MHRRQRSIILAIAVMLTTSAARAADTQPLNDNELKAREATAQAGAIEAAAKAQSAINAAQLPNVGDLSKYRLDAPEAKLDAQVAALAYAETGLLAEDTANAIWQALQEAGNTTKPTLLLASARTRTLLLQARAVEQSLIATQASLDNMTLVLQNDIAAAGKPTSSKVTFAALPAAAMLPAIAAIGEAGVAFASALRSSYKFGGVDNTTQVSAAFSNRVVGGLIKHVNVLQVEAIMSGALHPQSSVLTAHENLVRAALRARAVVTDALDKARQLRQGPLPDGTDDSAAGKERKAILDRADALTQAAIKHNANVDAVDKALATLATADAQGDSPLDQALRGSVLAANLKRDKVYTLSFGLAASKADVVAKNGLISGLKLAVGSHSIATWQLVDQNGVIIGSGSGAKSTKLQQVAKDLFIPSAP